MYYLYFIISYVELRNDHKNEKPKLVYIKNEFYIVYTQNILFSNVFMYLLL